MNIRLVMTASTVVVLGLVAHRPAAACSCMPPPPPQEALASSAAVFEGTVTDVRDFQSGEPSLMGYEVDLRVGRRFKGAEADTVTVLTSESSASCGYGFEVGKTYLVYAGETEGRLGVSLCSRTARIEDAAEDLAVLGDGTTTPSPDPAQPLPPATEPGKRGCGGCSTGAGGGDVAGLLLVMAAALALRRRA